jgi:hypothetical protein
MAERIYIRGEAGLEPLEEQPFATEDELQELIADYPQLLDGEQVQPGDPRRWILITREQGIAETSGAHDRWAVDHLIIDQDAMPTLVEVKRSSNTEIRRTVVGQLLEYAAHAAQTWSADELRRTFRASTIARDGDPDKELATLLQVDSEREADQFWEQVAENLDARRLRLLFVADEIPAELARVTEFLNAQMRNIEVLAVEIKQFKGTSGQAIVPRVIGQTSAIPEPSGTSPRRKLTRDMFLQELGSKVARSAAKRLLDAAQESGATLFWGSSGVSIRMRCSAWKWPVTVAWLFPPSVSGWMDLTNISFGAAIFNYETPPGEELRARLESWIDQFSGDDFAVRGDPHDPGTKIWTVEYAAAAKHIDLLAERLTNVLEALKAV